MNERLFNLQRENDKAGAEMLIESQRFDRIKGNKPRAISAFNLFQTPEHIAAKMAAIFQEASNVLEPSAGLGVLLLAMQNRFPDAKYTLYENNADCAGELYRMNTGAKLMQRDFLESIPEPIYDAIIMNPPFKMWKDIKHINHAFKFLAPGGCLVALCANGPKQQAEFKNRADHWEELPAKSFKSTGTNVNVSMLILNN